MTRMLNYEYDVVYEIPEPQFRGKTNYSGGLEEFYRACLKFPTA
jgi:hypothetical protein